MKLLFLFGIYLRGGGGGGMGHPGPYGRYGFDYYEYYDCYHTDYYYYNNNYYMCTTTTIPTMRVGTICGSWALAAYYYYTK